MLDPLLYQFPPPQMKQKWCSQNMPSALQTTKQIITRNLDIIAMDQASSYNDLQRRPRKPTNCPYNAPPITQENVALGIFHSTVYKANSQLFEFRHFHTMNYKYSLTSNFDFETILACRDAGSLPDFPGDFPKTSLTGEFESNLQRPTKFAWLFQKFPRTLKRRCEQY